MKSRFLFFLFFIMFQLSLTFAPQVSQARWAEEADVSIECLENETTYKVAEDGKWEVETSLKLRALDESGRQAISTFPFVYDAIRSKVEILEAKTSTNGTDFPVSKKKIEDKPLASDPLGLKEDHQILIPFEQVNIGSTIHLKLKMTVFKTDIEKYFFRAITPSEEYLWKNMKCTVESALPLNIKVSDPHNVLKVVENKKDGKHILECTLQKPHIECLVGERLSFVDPADKTQVTFSTEKDYVRVGKVLSTKFQKILEKPLPQALVEIKNEASKFENEILCIEHIVNNLIEKIHYLGNWHTADGNLAPRPLSEIVGTGYGDCKEYSACLVAVLRALGYQANVALVSRGEIFVEEETCPGIHQFNHVIVKVISPSGKTYWVDPTNITTMVDGIYPDIADRPSLVLDPKAPTYERIPAIDHQHAKSNTNEELSIRKDGSIVIKGSFELSGENAQSYTQELIMNPLPVFKDTLIKVLSHTDDPINPQIKIPELKSRKVETQKVTYNYEEENTLLHTNLGYAVPLQRNWYKPYVETSQKHVGAIFVGQPETRVRTLVFKNVKAENLDRLTFSIKTPWVNAKREVFSRDHDVIVVETIEKLKSKISAKELKSSEFTNLRKTLREYCEGVAIVFSELETK